MTSLAPSPVTNVRLCSSSQGGFAAVGSAVVGNPFLNPFLTDTRGTLRSFWIPPYVVAFLFLFPGLD